MSGCGFVGCNIESDGSFEKWRSGMTLRLSRGKRFALFSCSTIRKSARVFSTTARICGSVANVWRGAAAWFMVGAVLSAAADSQGKLNPAAWGSDHAGKALPEYVTGDECLFCHRVKIGPSWPKNRHQSFIRQANLEPEALGLLKTPETHAPFAKLVEFVLGRTNQLRFLKRSDSYGELDLLSTRLHPAGQKGGSRLADFRAPHWETETFANQCAGCHSTGVDSRTKTFSAISIDCFSCHGDVDLDHTEDTTKILLAKTRDDPARVVMSICGSCHIRTGRSRASELPFPNNFVPGDNLFRDFDVDVSDAAIGKESPIDRHILRNIRDVVISGDEELTCLSCHNVHLGSSLLHQEHRPREICWTCHDGRVKTLLPNWSKAASAVCDY